MDCQAFFDLQRCGSTLSCEELSRYEDIVAQSDLELARTAVYPCNKENIAYLDECWDD